MDAAERLQILALSVSVAACGIRAAEIMTASRGRARCALARQIAMYLLHVECSRSLAATARLFRRHRSTVEHACGVVEDGRDGAPFDRAVTLLAAALIAQSTPMSFEGVYPDVHEP
jgi:hypothetical protein